MDYSSPSSSESSPKDESLHHNSFSGTTSSLIKMKVVKNKSRAKIKVKRSRSISRLKFQSTSNNQHQEDKIVKQYFHVKSLKAHHHEKVKMKRRKTPASHVSSESIEVNYKKSLEQINNDSKNLTANQNISKEESSTENDDDNAFKTPRSDSLSPTNTNGMTTTTNSESNSSISSSVSLLSPKSMKKLVKVKVKRLRSSTSLAVKEDDISMKKQYYHVKDKSPILKRKMKRRKSLISLASAKLRTGKQITTVVGPIVGQEETKQKERSFEYKTEKTVIEKPLIIEEGSSSSVSKSEKVEKISSKMQELAKDVKAKVYSDADTSSMTVSEIQVLDSILMGKEEHTKDYQDHQIKEKTISIKTKEKM